MLIVGLKRLSKPLKYGNNCRWLSKQSIAILLFSLFFSSPSLADNYQRLLKLINNPNVTISNFTTDGCSGGMSALWNLFEHSPPWENCCILHDKVYWQGGTAKQRLQADYTLKQCVHQAGYPLIADLMYHAVRTGGGPCTRLPWRWGYGWPHCPSNIINPPQR
ncbi:hypothetical protein [Spartinivicinus ruber]|uniref:hypothetical protein n=1 Tax=Spartinivicinus ruber TaxID=2683272 RepID=UPI001CA420AF|nr:hypothetical protein [Spartinivicinus ruber]